MKICILADSICLPRGPSWGDTPFEATYPYLLDRALRVRFGPEAPIVLTKGTRFGTTVDVLSDWFEEVELRRAEVVVVQVGGGDCAPRTLLPRERRWIDRLLPTRWRETIYALEKHYRRQIVMLFPHRRLVPPERFRENLRAIRRRAAQAGVRELVFINIPEISDRVEGQLPGVRNCGVQYNRILEEETRGERVHLIRLDQIMREHGGADRLTCDGSHLNAAGQRLLAAELIARLGAILPFEREMRRLSPDAPGNDDRQDHVTINLHDEPRDRIPEA